SRQDPQIHGPVLAEDNPLTVRRPVPHKAAHRTNQCGRTAAACVLDGHGTIVRATRPLEQDPGAISGPDRLARCPLERRPPRDAVGEPRHPDFTTTRDSTTNRAVTRERDVCTVRRNTRTLSVRAGLTDRSERSA